MVDGAPRQGRTRLRWFRWSWRDLKHNWVSVVTIAVVIAIGTGVFAGLGSTAEWRRQSNDASFSALALHDLRVSLSPGTFTDDGTLEDVIGSIESADKVSAVTERLVVLSQLSAETEEDLILVRSRVVGTDMVEDAPVDAIWVRDGTRPEVGETTFVLEAKFADYHDLPATGSVEVAGGTAVDYVGVGLGPEELFVIGPNGEVFAESDFAHLYMSLESAQNLVGRQGQVNDAVMTLTDPAAADEVAGQIEDELREAGVAGTVTGRDDVDAFRLLYDDIDNDQKIWTALSALILFAAAVAAFNLVSRVVDSQRREIGIGMALGVSRSRLAIRPMLVGVQVGVLGVIAGVIVGLILGVAMESLLRSFLPMPEYRTPFQPAVFGRAAFLGFLVPIAASALPTWNAVRVEPIEAIRTGHLAARGGRLSGLAGRIRLPGSSLQQMPLRNLLRNPRRTTLTILGVAAAITALIAVMGLLDSFESTIDRGAAEVTKVDPDRVVIQLDTFYESDSDVAAAIATAPEVAASDAGLRLPVKFLGDSTDDDIDVLLELLDFENARWVPTLTDQSEPNDGIVIAAKAASDTGAGVGDKLTIRYPERLESGAFTLTTDEFTVTGIHPNPVRNVAYTDLGNADRFGLVGLTNVAQAYPAADATATDIQRAAFTLNGVSSTQPVGRVIEIFDEALEQFVGFLFITSGAVLVLALLIAFNTSRITVDERRREQATMQAFGLPPRSVLGVVVREGVIVGVMATIVGLFAGTAMLTWILRSIAGSTLPDFGIERHVSWTTILVAAVVGIVAVAAAPLLLYRRMRRMNLPDTLRVME